MPILRPEIQRILQESGLTKTPSPSESTISEKLGLAGLSDDAIAEELELLARHSSNESTRLRALETALKVKGALKDAPPSVPSFTLVIQSHAGSPPAPSINPIIFPRQTSTRLSISLPASDKDTSEN